MTGTWPVAELDSVRKLHVLASAVSGAEVVTKLIPAPFDEVWGVAGDLEGGFGTFEPDMRSVRVISPEVAIARSKYGFRARFEVDLRPGWLWMQSRFLLVGLAAVPVEGGTLFAATGGIRIPGRAALVPVGVRRANQAALDRLAARF